MKQVPDIYTRLASLQKENKKAAFDMPMGLKMHCKTPDEIAISILAKLIDVKNTPPGSDG